MAARIRRYVPGDHDAVYDICVRTADAGGDARGKYRTDDLMPDLFAGPYAFLEPEHAFVLDDGERAVGYVLGTPDTAAFARAYRERWIPRLADRYQVPPDPPVTPNDVMLALHYWPERLLWSELPKYPAHLHIDLLPGFQGQGYGRQLIDTFNDSVAAAGAVGVHVCVVSQNTAALGFYERIGFGGVEVDEPGGVTYLGRALLAPICANSARRGHRSPVSRSAPPVRRCARRARRSVPAVTPSGSGDGGLVSPSRRYVISRVPPRADSPASTCCSSSTSRATTESR
jgi:ribosomal protein S18 acetylase RimI-like enzyme